MFFTLYFTVCPSPISGPKGIPQAELEIALYKREFLDFWREVLQNSNWNLAFTDSEFQSQIQIKFN